MPDFNKGRILYFKARRLHCVAAVCKFKSMNQKTAPALHTSFKLKLPVRHLKSEAFQKKLVTPLNQNQNIY